MPPEAIYTKFLDYGVIGCVLIWVLLKAEPRLRGIEDAIDRLSDAILLFLIAQEGVPENIRNRAMKLKEDVDSAVMQRRTKPPRS